MSKLTAIENFSLPWIKGIKVDKSSRFALIFLYVLILFFANQTPRLLGLNHFLEGLWVLFISSLFAFPFVRFFSHLLKDTIEEQFSLFSVSIALSFGAISLVTAIGVYHNLFFSLALLCLSSSLLLFYRPQTSSPAFLQAVSKKEFLVPAALCLILFLYYTYVPLLKFPIYSDTGLIFQ